MKKYRGKRIVSAIAAIAAITSASVYGGAYYGNYNTADMWTDVLYSEQTRLYGGRTTYTAWPGARSDHTTSIFAAISYENTWDVSQVFGKECQDLLFSSIESTNNYKDYFTDPDRLLEVNDIAEWNGFIFAVASGPKADIVSQTVTFTYGSGETVTENVAQRSADGTNGKTGNDSYLYVFDISEGKNYGEALVAKWHISDIAGSEKNDFAVFESVAADDDYICLTVNNANISGDYSDYSYDRGLVVLKNNITRGKTGIAPQRIDTADEDYRYGVKVMAEAYAKENIKSTKNFESVIIGDYWIMLPSGAVNLTKNGDKTLITEEKIIMADLSEVEQIGIGDKLSVCVSKMYNDDKRTIGTSLEEILPLEDNKSWYDMESPQIRGIKIDEAEMSFLVTYRETVGGKTNYYKRIYITDWSDPVRPKYVADYKYPDEQNNSGGTLGVNDSIFYYEGYYYIPSNYGIDVVKKFDENGAINPSYITTYLYDTDKWGTKGKVGVFVTGNYMWVWGDHNYNAGSESRMKLSGDKSEIVEFCGYGQRNRARTINNCNDVIRYNDKVYLMSSSNLFASMPSCVNVVDLSRAMPISVTIDGIPKEVSLPYTISGKCTGLNKVKISIDGIEDGYANAVKMPDGTYEWEYILTKPGKHTVLAEGVPFGNDSIKETADYAQYCGISASEISFGGNYSESGEKLDINITVKNSGIIDAEGRVVVGIYKDDILYSLGISDAIAFEAGKETEVNNIDAALPSYVHGYTVKAFLTSGRYGFAPYTASTELTLK